MQEKLPAIGTGGDVGGIIRLDRMIQGYRKLINI